MPTRLPGAPVTDDTAIRRRLRAAAIVCPRLDGIDTAERHRGAPPRSDAGNVYSASTPSLATGASSASPGAVVACLRQATSLPFIVTAGQIGFAIGALDASTAAAFVAAGLVSALAFPALALTLLQRRPATEDDVAPAEREMIVS